MRAEPGSHENNGYVPDEPNNNGEGRNGSTREGHYKKSLVQKKSDTYKHDGKHGAVEEEEDEELDLRCGLWKFKTNLCGGKFANLYVFALCAGLSGLFTTMVHQVLHTQLTSLERQFHIDNKKAGLFDTSSKIGFMVTILFAGHFAKQTNIPLTVGLSGIIQGTVLAIPGFLQISDPYTLPPLEHKESKNASMSNSTYMENEKYLCVPIYHTVNGTTSGGHTLRNDTGEGQPLAYYVIMVVQAVKGVTDAFHSGFLTTLYMDDNMLDKSKMGIFLGMKYVMHDLASPIGKQINGILTDVPIDLKKTDLTPSDPRFVAAWWLAFLMFGLATAVFSFPIVLFPKKLVTSKQRREALSKAMVTFAGGAVEDEVRPISTQLKAEDAVRKSSIIMTSVNSHYAGSRPGSRKDSKKSLALESGPGSRRASLFPPVIGPTERKVSIDGQLVFNQPLKRPPPQNHQQKRRTRNNDFKELLKDFPQSFARVMKQPVFILMLVDIAIVSIPMSGTAMFKSTYMTNEYNVPMSEVSTITAVTSAVGHIAGTLISSWISSRVHTKLGYMGIVLGTYLFTTGVGPIYILFGCDNQLVYGATGDFGVPMNSSEACDCMNSKQLISCGSDGLNYLSPCYAGCNNVDGKYFTNCSVLYNNTNGNSVTPGLCPTDCHTNFLIYVIVHGLSSLVSSMAMIPRRLMILRLVDPRDRAFATSLFAFCGSLLGIPAPNLFGGFIDDTCLIWDGDLCTLYDRDKIRYLITGLDVGVHACVQITYLIIMGIFKYESRKLKREQRKHREDQEANLSDDAAIKPEDNMAPHNTRM